MWEQIEEISGKNRKRTEINIESFTVNGHSVSDETVVADLLNNYFVKVRSEWASVLDDASHAANTEFRLAL